MPNVRRGITLDEVVPWGRSYDEYVAMFDLRDADLRGKRILGCGDGPASFNAEATMRGLARVESCDPIYAFSSEQIRARVQETAGPMLAQVRQRNDHFVWGRPVQSLAHLSELRLGAMDRFLADFAAGALAGRYVTASLPRLSFADGAFDLAVCSHLLFLYSEQLTKEFHVAAARELCRIAREVRIFPLLELNGDRSRHLDAVADALRDVAVRRERRVPYEFLRGANEMLVLRALE